MSQLEQPKRIRVLLGAAAVLLVTAYLAVAFWSGFSVAQKRVEDVLPHYQEVAKGSCDYFKKYFPRLVPPGDARMWLFEDYLTLTFDDRILTDPPCVGLVLTDLARTLKERNYREKIVIRFLHSESKKIEFRMVVNP